MHVAKGKERGCRKGMKEDELNNLRTYLANAVFCDSLLKIKLQTNEFNATPTGSV
jgi:hypothetical protein